MPAAGTAWNASEQIEPPSALTRYHQVSCTVAVRRLDDGAVSWLPGAGRAGYRLRVRGGYGMPTVTEQYEALIETVYAGPLFKLVETLEQGLGPSEPNAPAPFEYGYSASI